MKLEVTHRRIKVLVATAVLAVLAIFFSLQSLSDDSSAADIRNFDPGNIMSDAVMSNKDTMSVQDIQNFLNSKNYCDNQNIHMADWYPHLQYSIKDGRFVCMARDIFSGKSAAQLIWEVGQEFNINPQVLIVLLEKEQGLVSDTWPNHIQYRSATGYGCPDTAPCDSEYYGLENQLKQAAKLFRTVLNGGWSNYPVGQRYVQYHPNAECGGSVINIQNRATSALYRYTPYQPNQSALNAGYGTGDSCGAYGNRNFWRLFTDWFGRTHYINYEPMESSRWMRLNKDATKIDLNTSEPAGELLRKNQQIKFIDKAAIDGRLYLRTEYNYKNGGDFAIAFSDLEEIPYESIAPEWKIINYDGVHRYTPSSETWMMDDDNLPIGTILSVASKITVNGITSYRTQYNTDNNQNAAFREERLDDLTSLLPLETPRTMTALRQATLTTLDGKSCKTIPQYQPLFIKGKFIYNGITYFSETQLSFSPSESCFIRADSMNISPIIFEPFDSPRYMQISQNVARVDLYTGRTTDYLQKGSVIHFSSKVVHNNQLFFRTTHNTDSNGPFGVPARYVSETIR